MHRLEAKSPSNVSKANITIQKELRMSINTQLSTYEKLQELGLDVIPDGLSDSQFNVMSLKDIKTYLDEDDEGKAQIRYFMGFTTHTEEVRVTSNKEILMYQEYCDKVELKTVAQMLDFTPHKGQQPIFYTYDEQKDIYNCIVMVLGRRAQPLTSVIKAPNGDITFKDVKVGDVIFDPDGGLQTVKQVHDIYKGDVYEVQVGNKTCKVDSEHLFTVHSADGCEVKAVHELLADARGVSYFSLEAITPVNYPAKDLPKDAYSFGLDCISIPECYLTSSIQDRLSVLKGLYDSRGSTCGILVHSLDLLQGIKTLVYSLGGDVETSTVGTELYAQPTFKEFNVIKSIKPLPSEPVRCISVSSDSECYVTDDYIRTHNTGKSASTSVIAVKELMIPFSSTILLTPTFNNAKIIFNEVLKHVQALKLPIKSINKGSFRFELTNGARFSANSASNIESALGTANSLLICDESQSIPGLEEIMNQMLVPTLLDYGMRPSGILYGKQIYLGTPRGEQNQLFNLYCKQDEFGNWKSFSAPSHSNPILPTSYFEQMRLVLGQMLYEQEILAKFIGTDDNVFYAFGEHNTYKDGSIKFSKHTDVVVGIDVGFRDSTAAVFLYRDAQGSYYLDKAYSENMKATSVHVKSLKDLDSSMVGTVDLRYMDPSAAQLICDYIQDYDYEVSPAKNNVQESIKYLNLLMTPTGANEKPRLYVNEELTEVIRQIQRVRWRDKTSKTSKDPFSVDPKGTHWDIIAALRYALYSDKHNISAGTIIQS